MVAQFDVVIIGAGPSGSSAAFFLARAGVKVLLLDKAAFPRDKTCGDCIIPRGFPILAEMAVLESLMARAWKLNNLEVSSPSGRSVHFAIPPLPHAPNYAVVIPRLILDNLLLDRAVAVGAEFRGDVHVRGLNVDAHRVTLVHHQSEETVSASLAVVATGASTALLNNVGLNPPQPNIVAARAYFENIQSLPPHFQFRFDGVVLPGYGWVFPLSPTSANIGAGFIRAPKQKHNAVQTAFTQFLQSPALKHLLTGSKQVGALKSFPIRTDFSTASTYAERVLLVGEAAGLVNPLTGDGIDFALESGKLAAEHILHMLRLGDFSLTQLRTYDTILRQRYLNLFRFSGRVSRLSLNRRALDWLVPVAISRPRLAEALVNILLGVSPVPERLSWLRIVKGVASRL